jgi:hypothetical protein
MYQLGVPPDGIADFDLRDLEVAYLFLILSKPSSYRISSREVSPAPPKIFKTQQSLADFLVHRLGCSTSERLDSSRLPQTLCTVMPKWQCREKDPAWEASSQVRHLTRPSPFNPELHSSSLRPSNFFSPFCIKLRNTHESRLATLNLPKACKPW